MRDVLISGRDLCDFGRLLHETWQVKKGLESSISNTGIDDLYQRGMRAGALGGKLLGAGSGGFLLLFCEPQRQDAVRRVMTGAKEIPFQFEPQGSKIIYVGEDQWSFAEAPFLIATA
jgi:D-glycero-alpha-D-manno-heptose-7-phosphate kinase